MDLSLNMGHAVIHHLININVRFHFSSMFSKHATLELLLSRLHWSEVDLQLLVVPAGDSHASHVSDHSVLSRVGGRPWCPGPRVAWPGPHQGWVTAGGHWPALHCSRRRPQRAQRKRPGLTHT